MLAWYQKAHIQTIRLSVRYSFRRMYGLDPEPIKGFARRALNHVLQSFHHYSEVLRLVKLNTVVAVLVISLS